MKKILQLLVLFLFGSLQSYGTHDLGGSLTYMCVGPNTYLVTYSHYSWYVLSNPAPAGRFTLKISAPGCNTGRIIPLQFKSTQPGTPLWFSGANNPYNIGELTATVTFTAAEAACSEWVLSVAAGSRMGGESLPNNSPIDIYTEATLKLDANINNSSPVFDPQNESILIAAPYQPITLSVGAYDPDGDSLVYSMATPLTGENQPVNNYVQFGNPVGIITNPNPLPPYTTTPPNIQYAAFPQINFYGPGFPLLSYTVDWNQINPATGIPFPVVQPTPYFDLDAATGSLSFIPMPVDTLDKFYIVAFQVDEYRKINGTATKIGSIRRETFIYLGHSPGNQNPVLMNRMINNDPAQTNAAVTIMPGATFTYEVDASDANSADSVYLVSNATTALPGANFTVNSARQQSATVTWTPTTADVRDQPYFLRIWVKDNASPFAGRHVETVAVKVSNTGGVTGTKADLQLNKNFTAFPNPFTEQINFKFSQESKAETIIIYNLLGRQIDEIQLKTVGSGEQKVQWQNANKHAAGTYIAKLVSKDKTIQTLKFTKVQ